MSSRIQDENVFSTRRPGLGLPLTKKPSSTLNENAKHRLQLQLKPLGGAGGTGSKQSTSQSQGQKVTQAGKSEKSAAKPRTALASLSKPSLNATPTPKLTTTHQTDKPRPALAVKSNVKPLSTSTSASLSNSKPAAPKAPVPAPSTLVKSRTVNKPSALSHSQTQTQAQGNATPGPTRRVLPKSTKKTLSIYTPARPVIKAPLKSQVPEVEFTHPAPAVHKYEAPSPVRDIAQGRFAGSDFAGLEFDIAAEVGIEDTQFASAGSDDLVGMLDMQERPGSALSPVRASLNEISHQDGTDLGDLPDTYDVEFDI